MGLLIKDFLSYFSGGRREDYKEVHSGALLSRLVTKCSAQPALRPVRPGMGLRNVLHE